MPYQLNVFTGTLDRVNSSSGGGAIDSLTNTDGATLTLTTDSSPFGQAILHVPPGIETDTNYNAAHNLNFAAGTNADGSGAFLPGFSLAESGTIIITTNNPATSGNNTFQIVAEDGFYLSKDGANPALIKTDLLTAGHTYQFPDSGGTVALSEALTQIIGRVDHGADNSVARPTGYYSIQWVGSVEPLNATDFDTWIDTT